MLGAPRGGVPGVCLLAESCLCLVGSSLRTQVLSQHRKGPAEGWAPNHTCVPRLEQTPGASDLGET